MPFVFPFTLNVLNSSVALNPKLDNLENPDTPPRVNSPSVVNKLPSGKNLCIAVYNRAFSLVFKVLSVLKCKAYSLI